MSLVLEGVGRDFIDGHGRMHRAVADVSLEVPPGTFCTLLGPSGCGKTTLLRMIAGFETPTRGTIHHDGRALDRVPPYRRGFPMVFQSYALFPHMTVAQNVAYGLRVRRVAKREQAARVERALALLGLLNERDRHPAQLSGGQQQRVALARALVVEPPLILLDEPLSNLDAALRVSMRGEIRALQRRLGLTALYVTHDQEEALAISDTVVVMNAGSIEQVGTAADVFHRPRTEWVARFMGCPNIIHVERVAPGAIRLLGEEYIVPAPTSATRAVLRPEDIDLRPDGRHSAAVEEVTFLGARVQLVLRLADGTPITAHVPALHELGAAPGDAVRFAVPAARLHYL